MSTELLSDQEIMARASLASGDVRHICIDGDRYGPASFLRQEFPEYASLIDDIEAFSRRGVQERWAVKDIAEYIKTPITSVRDLAELHDVGTKRGRGRTYNRCDLLRFEALVTRKRTFTDG